MPVPNSEIAALFLRLADLLEIQGENVFRIRAYRSAARAIGEMTTSAAEMIRNGRSLTDIPGIGKDLAGKIEEIVKTRKLRALELVERKLPPGLSDLMRIPGLGGRRAGVLYRKLGITTLDELEAAANESRIRQLPGFGPRIEETILQGIAQVRRGEDRIKLATAEQVVLPLLSYLERGAGVKRLAVAGSYRRRRETIRDLDLLVCCSDPAAMMARFLAYEDVAQVLANGKTRSSVLLRSGIHVDLRAVPFESYGSALHYFTGSRDHNIAIRKMGVRRGLKINEYGVYRRNRRIGGQEENDVFAAVNLPYIDPELREDRGEIEAALSRSLPPLITLSEIRGDLHVHTKSTDGHHSLEDMVRAARAKRYEYMAITDHSQRLTVARGLTPQLLLRQMEEIDRLNSRMQSFRILKGIEADILEDGSLDLPDSVLQELDLVVCSVHYKFNLSRQKQTERILRALDHPCFTVLAHPTGRLINERDPYEIDLERIMLAAKERNCFLELNSYPDRLDLNDFHCKMAKDIGVKIVISTDAHSVADLDFMRFGVGQARRGWLEPHDVLNTRGLRDLLPLLRKESMAEAVAPRFDMP